MQDFREQWGKWVAAKAAGRDRYFLSGDSTVPQFTPVEAKMVAVLQDGGIHPIKELHACLVDELGALSNVSVHLTAIRKKLRLVGQDILCINGTGCYCLVRRVAGKTE